MDTDRIYTKDEIQPLMLQGAVFMVMDYGIDSNKVYWDNTTKTFMYKGMYDPELAIGALKAREYKMLEPTNIPTKRGNPWLA